MQLVIFEAIYCHKPKLRVQAAIRFRQNMAGNYARARGFLSTDGRKQAALGGYFKPSTSCMSYKPGG